MNPDILQEQELLKDGERPKGLTQQSNSNPWSRPKKNKSTATQYNVAVDYTPKVAVDSTPTVDFEEVQRIAENKSVGISDNPYADKMQEFNQQFAEGVQKNTMFNQVLEEKYGNKYKVNKNLATNYGRTIQQIAEQVSPYYRKYVGTDYLTMTDKEWQDASARYLAAVETYGEAQANLELDATIKNNIASNQSIGEKTLYSVQGMGAQALSGIISTVGMLYGIGKNITGYGTDTEGLGEVGDFINNVFDNELTRYANDISQYGTIFHLDEAKEQGLSKSEILSTDDQANAIFSINTPFEVLQSSGYTLASILSGAAYSKAANLAFNSFKRLTPKVISDLNKGNKILLGLQKAENFTNRWVIPGAVGSSEATVNALQTKINIQEKGQEEVFNTHRKLVEEQFTNILNTFREVWDPQTNSYRYFNNEGKEIDTQSLYLQIWNSMEPKLQESLQQVEYTASTAGIGNFLINSAINGSINATLKAGLQSESVQNALRNGKLTKWAFPKNEFRITGNAGNVDVTPTISRFKQYFFAGKEVLGEFKEEYLQANSDAFFNGFADANIHNFIDNKYNGDAQAVVGETFAGDWGAAWNALGNSLVSKESLKAGIYGALGSILGTAKLSGYRSIDGKLFSRGKNAKGEQESNWDMIKRLTPWRSGLVASINQTRKSIDIAIQQAQDLQNWLNDPNNKSKFNDVVGSYSWMREMNESSILGDEYNYRNSSLGKAINDIFMLQKIEGTDMYNSIMEQFVQLAYLEEGSTQAQEYINAIKENVNTKDSEKSDQEIFKELTSNAKKTLDLMSSIKSESKKLEQLLGALDEDVKQSLIFAKLSIDDWTKRSNSITQELQDLKISNSKEKSSSLTKEQQDVISEYQTLERAKAALEGYLKSIDKLKEDIKSLETRNKKTKLSKPEQAQLIKSKTLLNTLKTKVKPLQAIAEMEIDVNNTVLNESEIMNLDPIKRAKMILEGKKALYYKLYKNEDIQEAANKYTKEQQEVIDKLVEQGMAQDKDFLAKIVDLGRLESAKNTFLKQYNSVLTDQRGLISYAAEAKAQAKDALAREQGKSLNKITSYKEFKNALDSALSNKDARSARALIQMIKDNENFSKWQTQHEVVKTLFDTVANHESFQNLDGNTADLFASALGYLYENGVDLNNIDEVLNALREIDERGYNKFVSYIDNQNTEEGTNTVFTGIEEVFITYKNILEQAQYDKQEQEKIKAPIKTDVNVKQQKPPAIPIPQKSTLPGIFANLPNKPTPDPLLIEEQKEREEREKSKKQEKGDDTINSTVINTFKTANNSDNIISIMKSILSTLKEDFKNYSNLENIQEIEKDVIALLEEAGKRAYTNISELYLTLRSIADNAPNTEVKSIINRALDLNQSKIKDIENSTKKSDNVDNKDANTIETSNINAIIELGPKFLKDWYEVHTIERFLSSNYLSTNPTVYFITDESLTDQMKDYLKNNNVAYTDDNLPIILAVEHPEGKYKIGEKSYQPIGMLPKTGSDVRGSNRIKPIREAALSGNTTEISLVQYEGKPLTTTLMGTTGGITAAPKDKNFRGNVNVQEIILNDLTDKEAEEAKSMSIREYHKTSFYKSLKKRIIDNLSHIAETNTLIFNLHNLKGNKSTVNVFAYPIHETTNSLNIPLKSINWEDPNNVIEFNSRTRRFYKNLKEFIEKIPSVHNTEETTLNDIQNSAENLTKTLNRFIYLSGYEYQIEFDTENDATLVKVEKDSDTKTDDKNIIYERKAKLYAVNSSRNSDDKIELGTIVTGGVMTEDDYKKLAASIIKNLLFDEEGKIRTTNGIDTLIKWQIDYSEVDVMNSESEKKNLAKETVESWIDDGLIGMAATSLQYKIHTVSINSPFTSKGNINPNTSSKNIGNKDNASIDADIKKGKGINSVRTVKGDIVDGDTGVVIEETLNKSSEPINNTLSAEQKVQDIIQNSKLFKLSDDEKYYINTKTGKQYARVTSIIAADEEGERFEDNNWVLPSTTIGTTVDTFVRDFFSGTLKTLESGDYDYPNANQIQWKAFKKQLENLKMQLDARGLNVVPKDVTITGVISVTDSEGKTYSIDTAGTLDLLVYDAQGNFYILDMKTIRNLNTIKEKIPKWSRQLSLYQKFIEDAYGIKVRGRCIIPIGVTYPDATKGQYTIGQKGELLYNEKPVQADPTLVKRQGEYLIEVPFTELNIQYDKLTDEERDIATKATEQVEAQEGISIEKEVAVEVVESENTSKSIENNILDMMNDVFGNSLEDTQNMTFLSIESEEEKEQRKACSGK